MMNLKKIQTSLLVIAVLISAFLLWPKISSYIPSTAEISSTISSSFSSLISEIPQSELEKNNEVEYAFSDNVNQIEFTLKPYEWSGWVTTPPASTYRISTGNKPIKICFIDGKCTPYERQEIKYLGIKRGIFHLYSEEEMKVIITIER